MFFARVGILLVLSIAANAELLPSGAGVEIRLLKPVGSRISHPGDSIEAVVIAPAIENGQVLIPPGSKLSGRVQSVGRLGLGLKRPTANLELQFEQLHFPDGLSIPIRPRVQEVETAKERVNSEGVVGGINPAANVSSTASFYVLPILCLDPAFGVPVLAVKFLIARSPDSEIYFPAGTELVLRLVAPLEVPSVERSRGLLRPISDADLASARSLLNQLPTQQAHQGAEHPSDLLNVLFLGTGDQIGRAFRAAGWSGAQERSLLTTYRIYHCMVQRTPYSAAPMGKLTLNGLLADADFQKSLNTFSKRHHLRLWQQPGGTAWFSAATEDISYKFRRGRLTHASDRYIDNERTKVLNDLAFTGCLDSASLVSRNWTYVADRGSKSIQTDGKIAVLRLNDCLHPNNMPSSSAGQGRDPNRGLQILRAVGVDLVRSNPVSLVLNTRRMVGEAQGYRLNAFRLRRNTSSQASVAGSSPADQEGELRSWARSSFLDTPTRTQP